MSDTMRAALVREFGGPEALRAEEVVRPEPGEGEVLIELEAAGVNRADALTRSGRYHAAGQPPIVPGFEGSGVVRGVGATVTGVGVGDRVFAFGGRPGFYAEYAAVHEGRVVRMPEGLDWDPAAALPVASLTAFYCLRRLGYDPKEDLAELANAVVGGDLKVHVDRAFPSSEAAEAHRHLEGRLNRGKIVLHPGE